MRRLLVSLAVLTLISLVIPSSLEAFPKPSAISTAWELNFEHSTPKRIVVSSPENPTPRAYWYITYLVTNNTDQERSFLPVFEIMTEDGQITRSDRLISTSVFNAIQQVEKKPLLEPAVKIAGRLLMGEDQAREGVAIWPEPNLPLAGFTVFVSGLSGQATLFRLVNGEYVQVDKGEELKDTRREDLTVLRKTLRLDYRIPGGEPTADGTNVVNVGREWIMR